MTRTGTASAARRSVVALAGDWHGNTTWAADRIAEVAARGVRQIWHLGDFGIWPGLSGERFLDGIEVECTRHAVEILVTPGNHEYWARLEAEWSLRENRDEQGVRRPLLLREHIAILPRGFAWTESGRKVVSLGGAPSVDFPYRREGRDWWREEAITDDDVELTIGTGHGADVMLTHDSPGGPYWTPAVEAICTTNDFGWTRQALAYGKGGRLKMTEAFLGVRPRLLAHGHYHCHSQTTVRIPGVGHPTTIWSLDCDGNEGNVRYLDLDTLSDPEPQVGADG